MQQHRNSNKVMETGNHFKNGASLKSQMSRGNFRLFTLLAFMMLFGFRAMAQDVIVLKSGDEIQSLVQEVGTEYVKYKKFDNQAGPVYNVAIKEIFMIKYVNGSKDVFNEPEKPQSPKIVEEAVKATQGEVKQEPQIQRPVLSVVSGDVSLDGKAIKYEQVVNILASNDLLTNVGTSDIYKSGHSRLQTARAFGWISLTSLGVGLASTFVPVPQKWVYDPSTGGQKTVPVSSFYGTAMYVCYGVTIISSITSFTIKASGDNRINDAINIYNTSIQPKHKSDMSMNFGITPSGGIGLTLNF